MYTAEHCQSLLRPLSMAVLTRQDEEEVNASKNDVIAPSERRKPNWSDFGDLVAVSIGFPKTERDGSYQKVEQPGTAGTQARYRYPSTQR